ncbi:MAG: hypothetical protein EPN70_14415 [Paraburkholderia sp.]|nr:MAG: hypothetical protein EPN70_14415 [Paraburkholderia sp.]TAM29237.1 MAG: hypothetical protein EPN59_13160 [Paraburkholderia sp.]
MNYHQIEKDIQHLEHVITRMLQLDRMPFPLSYWRSRIDTLETVLASGLYPSHSLRVQRLREALSR